MSVRTYELFTINAYGLNFDIDISNVEIESAIGFYEKDGEKAFRPFIKYIEGDISIYPDIDDDFDAELEVELSSDSDMTLYDESNSYTEFNKNETFHFELSDPDDYDDNVKLCLNVLTSDGDEIFSFEFVINSNGEICEYVPLIHK